MSSEKYEKMKVAVHAVLDDKYSYCKGNDGIFHMDIYADYRDEIGLKAVEKICGSKDPKGSFAEWLRESYSEAEFSYIQDLSNDIRSALECSDGAFPNGLNEDAEAEENLELAISELVCWDYPSDHFLKQEVCVNIMLDTGDGNTDFTLNSPYPCWYGRYEDTLDDRSSLLWLARQQGYTKTLFWNALRKGDMADPKGFLESCRVELANLSSSMAVVVFLVKLELKDLIKLNHCIQSQEQSDCHDNAANDLHRGYIVVDKGAMTGLYDPWNGGGSVLEIELEKDVRIPIRFIRSALPDGCDGHSIEGVYGICRSAWHSDAVKAIHKSQNVERLEALAG